MAWDGTNILFSDWFSDLLHFTLGSKSFEWRNVSNSIPSQSLLALSIFLASLTARQPWRWWYPPTCKNLRDWRQLLPRIGTAFIEDPQRSLSILSQWPSTHSSDDYKRRGHFLWSRWAIIETCTAAITTLSKCHCLFRSNYTGRVCMSPCLFYMTLDIIG